MIAETGNERAKEFPGGFAFGQSVRKLPSNYVSSQVISNLYLDGHSSNAQKTDGAGHALHLIGDWFCTHADVGADDVPSWLLESLKQSETALFEALDHVAGRYVLAYFDQTMKARRPKILSDACAVRSVYFSRSYGIVASHIDLIRSNVPHVMGRSQMPDQWGYPGSWTGIGDIRMLIANNLLSVDGYEMVRYYPREPVKEEAVKDVVAVTTQRLMRIVEQHSTKTPSMHLGLTGGLDSRLTLAIYQELGRIPPCVTYVFDERSERDSEKAEELARMLSAPHRRLDATGGHSERLASDITKFSHYRYARRVFQAMMDGGLYGQVFVASNLVEIGRRFYEKGGLDVNDASKPEGAADLYVAEASRKRRGEVLEYGADRFEKEVLTAFREYYVDTDCSQAMRIIDPLDLLYWEHRMSCWHGPMTLARDVVCETFIPYNCRSVIEPFLGVSPKARRKGEVQKGIIENINPTLLECDFV